MTALSYLPELAIALSGGFAGFLAAWFTRPKVQAEAAKAQAEGKALDWARFHSEIARQDAKIEALEERLKRQDAEIENLRHDRDDSDGKLVIERRANRRLKEHVGRLEARLAAIEGIFNRHVLTPEMRAELDSIDDK